ncbi:MAG TPA: ATP-dependent Clp protease ATP-binding subunit, partial [Planctomycetes bacterium]|nr:ATP-dependent Clp protease ATP-binding subunit [Planctomycetota bacterium]
MPLKSQFVLSGNVRDFQIQEHAPGVAAPAPLIAVLDAELQSAGFQHVLVYEPVRGFRSAAVSPEAIKTDGVLLGELGLTPSEGSASAGPDLFADVLPRLVHRGGAPIALIVDFASRLVIREDTLLESEQRLFTRAYVSSLEAQPRPFGADARPYFNNICWVVEKEVDLPDWLIIGNPRIRHIPVPKPDHRARRAVAGAILQAMPGALEPESSSEIERAFVEATEGLLLSDMMAVAELGRAENVEVTRISDAVRRYKLGVIEDPWKNLDRDRIRNGESFVSQRVRGQGHAVTHMLDIIKRAVTGVGGAGRA